MEDFKWLIIGFATIMSVIAIGETVDSYAAKQCRIAAITAQVPADEIGKACGIK
mgnify:CR=1 FL=1